MTKWVPQVAGGAATILVLCGCSSLPPVEQAFSGGSVQFACGNGESVEMQFSPGTDRGVLRRSGWTVELPKRAADKGYAFSNGLTTVQGAGSEMTIQVGHLAPVWCRSQSTLIAGGR